MTKSPRVQRLTFTQYVYWIRFTPYVRRKRINAVLTLARITPRWLAYFIIIYYWSKAVLPDSSPDTITVHDLLDATGFTKVW